MLVRGTLMHPQSYHTVTISVMPQWAAPIPEGMQCIRIPLGPIVTFPCGRAPASLRRIMDCIFPPPASHLNSDLWIDPEEDTPDNLPCHDTVSSSGSDLNSGDSDADEEEMTDELEDHLHSPEASFPHRQHNIPRPLM